MKPSDVKLHELARQLTDLQQRAKAVVDQLPKLLDELNEVLAA